MVRRTMATIGLVGALFVQACATPPPPSPSPATAAPTASPTATPSPTPSPSPTPAPTPTPTPTPSPSPTPVPSSAIFVTHGSRTAKTVALSFDDGFNVPACISIVDTLLAKHATATFFPNGQYVREAPSFWHWVAAQGFAVGSHGTTHHDPTTLSAEELLLSLGSERRILDETLVIPSIDAYRPAYGSFNSLVLQVAGLAGYPRAVGWDVDSRDQLGVKTVDEEIANATAGRNGSIVLMHCGSPFTPHALPTIIDRYRARGFSFVTIPEMVGLGAPAAPWNPPAAPDTWPAAAVPAPGDAPVWNGSLAIDGAGHHHLVYETPGGIISADDVTGVWRSAMVVASTGSAFVSRPALAIDGAGLEHLVYVSATASGTSLLYRHQESGGTWSSPSTVAALGAPASTATIAIDRAGAPIVIYARVTGAGEGLILASPSGSNGWSRTLVPTTDGTFLSPSIALDPKGAIHLFARRNGHSEVDETTNASGTWRTVSLLRVPASAVPFAGFDASGRLLVALQPLFGGEIRIGTRTVDGTLSWATVTGAGDLSGLAITSGGNIEVAFSRILEAGGPSRIWLAQPPRPRV